MIAKTTLLIASTLLALTGPALAQYGEGSAGSQSSIAAPPASTKPGTFENLSAGDRKIARALFLAQRPTASGPAPMSLNQIAEIKAGSTWAKVFNQMQSRGLLQAKNLGQIVSSYEHQRSDNSPLLRSNGRSSGAPTLVTGGNGSVVASSQRGGIAHGGDIVGETGSADIAAADKPRR